jgi:hypothetical protein
MYEQVLERPATRHIVIPASTSGGWRLCLEVADAPTGDRVAAVLNSRSGGTEMRGWQQDSRAWRQRESRAAAAGL